MMKIIYFFFVSVVLISIPSVGQTKGPVGWVGIREAFAAYSEYPSSANAMKVMSLLPESDVKNTNERKESEAIQFVYQNIGMLERQVISRDPEAIKLAFKLKTIADGAFAEDLDIVLGQLIRIDPALFLRQLRESQVQIGRLDSLVGNFGDVYADKIEAQRLETEKRIHALEGVSDSALKEIRDECIGELKRQLAAESEKH